MNTMNALARHSPQWLPTVVNAVGFNIVWFITVFGAAGGLAWAGPSALLIFALVTISMSARPRYDLAAMAVFATAGLVLDSAWSVAGAVNYSAGWPFQQLAPIWLVTLWAAFALTVGHSLAWLRPRPVLAGLFGLLGGGFSYWVGARVGAVELAIPAWQYGIGVGLVWAIALPALIRLTAVAAHSRLPTHQR
jgi:hypothetical protein